MKSPYLELIRVIRRCSSDLRTTQRTIFAPGKVSIHSQFRVRCVYLYVRHPFDNDFWMKIQCSPKSDFWSTWNKYKKTSYNLSKSTSKSKPFRLVYYRHIALTNHIQTRLTYQNFTRAAQINGQNQVTGRDDRTDGTSVHPIGEILKLTSSTMKNLHMMIVWIRWMYLVF